MTVKMMFVVLTTVALIGSGVTTGYAGGGGAGAGDGTFFFQCYPVKDGPNPPHVLEVDDQFINPTIEDVGKLKMICSFQPNVTSVGDDPASIVALPGPFDHITCYEAKKAKAKATVSYTDNFFSDPQTVKVDGPVSFICAGANKTCLKGCPGITEP